MFAVAVVAVLLALAMLKKRRDERLRSQAFYSGLEAKYTSRSQAYAPSGLPTPEQERLNYVRAMRQKWEWGAWHPWESVEPDPP
jgi:hypothetical protein